MASGDSRPAPVGDEEGDGRVVAAIARDIDGSGGSYHGPASEVVPRERRARHPVKVVRIDCDGRFSVLAGLGTAAVRHHVHKTVLSNARKHAAEQDDKSG